MAEQNDKEKLKNDVQEKLKQLKHGVEVIKLPEDLKKDLIMVLKRITCKLCLGSIEPEEIVSHLCFLENAIKMNQQDDIRKAVDEMIATFSRSSSCAILGDHCVRSSREERSITQPE